jgi:hypothetical protein
VNLPGIPGFTAEASLYRTPGNFNSAEDPTRFALREAILPQARVLEGFCLRNGTYCCFKNPDGTWTCSRTIAT